MCTTWAFRERIVNSPATDHAPGISVERDLGLIAPNLYREQEILTAGRSLMAQPSSSVLGPNHLELSEVEKPSYRR